MVCYASNTCLCHTLLLACRAPNEQCLLLESSESGRSFPENREMSVLI